MRASELGNRMSHTDTVRIALSISSRPGRPAEQMATYRGVQVAVEELNERLERPVELAVYDDEGEPSRTEALAREMVADPSVVGVVGPMGSTEALTNAPIFAEAGLAQISPCASHQDLCHPDNGTFYRLVPSEEVQGRELSRVAREYLGANHVSVVRADSEWATALAENFVPAFERSGGTIAPEVTFPPGTESFTGAELDDLLDSVTEHEPGVVFFLVHNENQGVPLASGLRDRGVDVPFLGANALEKGIGGGTEGEEVYQVHPGADFDHVDTAAAFRRAYTRRFPPDSAYSPEAYDAVAIFGELLRTAPEPTRAAVLDGLRELEPFDGASGRISFDGTGERVETPIGLYRVHQTEEGRKPEYLGRTSDLLEQG